MEIELVKNKSEKVKRMIEALQSIYSNGNVIFQTYKPIIIEEKETPNYVTFLKGNFLKVIIKDNDLPELFQDSREISTINFKRQSALEFEGSLANDLLTGGAYKKYVGSLDEVRTISKNFVNVLLKGDYSHAEIEYTSEAWSNFFLNGAWDKTYIIYDWGNNQISILCFTDTD